MYVHTLRDVNDQFYVGVVIVVRAAWDLYIGA